MTEMSMNKAIHGAVRRDLDRFVDALGRFPAGDATRAAELRRAWENLDDQLTHHHEGEHRIAWPHLRAIGVSDELLTAMDDEHDAMAAAMTNARAAIAALARDPSAENADAALRSFEQLRDVTGQHLDHEEAEFEDVYQEHREHPEMKAMGKEFSKVSPARGGRFFAWVLDGATPEERATVTRDVPGPVLAIIGGVFGRGYRKDVAPVWTR